MSDDCEGCEDRIDSMQYEITTLEEDLGGARDRIEALEDELTAAQKDAERLEWIERKLFVSAWNGVLDPGSNRDWRIHSGYRHVTARMQGGTFRNAIDAAIDAEKSNPPA